MKMKLLVGSVTAMVAVLIIGFASAQVNQIVQADDVLDEQQDTVQCDGLGNCYRECTGECTGECDGSCNRLQHRNGRGYGPGDGTGNNGCGPCDGTGYGAKNCQK